MRGLHGPAFLADTEEATIDRVDTYIPADERPRVREAIHRAIAAKDIFELEYRVRTARSVGRSRAIPLLDEVGEISEWFWTLHEVVPSIARAVPGPQT